MLAMNLSLKQLRAFLALAKERNFTRAAARCHVTQPALSALVNTLEEAAGARFFNRSTRSVELTAEGVLFESLALRLLQDFEQAFAELDNHVQRRKGKVAVAALASVAGGALPPVLVEFQRLYPGIDVQLMDVTSDHCLELLRARTVDLALTAAITPGPDLISKPLLSDTFHLICRDDHPMANHRRLTARQILRLPIIQFARSSSIRQHLDAAFYPAHLITSTEVINLMTAAGLVAAGLGVTIVPTLALFQFRAPGLVAIPLVLSIKNRDICLIRRKDGAESVAARAFIEVLEGCWRGPCHVV